MTFHRGNPTEGTDEYRTDPELWRPISRVIGGFDVDVAAPTNGTPIAPEWYDRTDNGLAQTWTGKVWLNPPFSEKSKWYKKAKSEVREGNAELVVALAPADISTDWFQRDFSSASLLCWLDKRDWYLADSSPNFGTVVGVFGDYPDELPETLQNLGVVTERIPGGVDKRNLGGYG